VGPLHVAAQPLGRYVGGSDVADHEDCSSKSAQDSPDGGFYPLFLAFITRFKYNLS